MSHYQQENELAVALSIAGSDSGAGAGIQADLLTFAAQGVYGTTALTCLTAQNPHGVSGVHAAPAAFVVEQCRQVCAHYRPKALKTGMLLNLEIVEAVAAFLAESKIPAVIDPVMVASSGAVLLSAEAIAAVQKKLLQHATLVTPNLDEATILLGRTTQGGEHCASEAVALAKRYHVPFLLKGGHGAGADLVDVLAWPDGRTMILTVPRIQGIDTHGSGCTLSAAITAQLARGEPLEQAVRIAHAYLQKAMINPMQVVGLKHIKH